MFYRILIFLFLIQGSVYSQNLVQNGGFEQYSSCPQNGSISNSIYWYDPSGATPDFFNSCAVVPGANVPNNFGYQYAKSGNGYAGFICYYDSELQREYLQQQIESPMIASKNYCVSAYFNSLNPDQYCIDNIGVYLSASAVSCIPAPAYCFIPVSPQISQPDGIYLCDTLNWIPIKGVYVASGGEEYITIGNFFSDALTPTYQVYPGNPQPSAYYYVDDISISMCRPPVLGNDTVILLGDNILIGDTAQDVAEYFWSPAAGLSCDTCWQTNASPTAPTIYTLTKITPCDTTTEDIFVDVTIGLEEYYHSFHYNVYPNPNAGTFTLSHPVFEEQVTIEVYDLSGRIVLKQNLSKSNTTQFSDVNVENGIYFYRVMKGTEQLSTGKVELLK